ncbi:hypothetical protein ABW99_19625 [Pandoraea thiooxydans]|uniref:DUF192 domain-containing protein n=1 Tax=Pandoraea thiooxydans TaxID=445709 RepID=A0A0G3EUT1_9BURK|nr:DUF192 domain-containing protein [Pandoraea thiooxydans]AKJ70725.1 hypothetical protein ABW99_19625 [Pandoraea thiooxydans]
MLRKISPLLCGFSVAALSFFSSTATAQIKPASQFPTTELTAGIYLIKAEVAANEPDREQGLMYRTQLPANQGMLFIFEQPAGHCFWMKNTFLPLSIAFLADDGTIVNIERMAPQTENNHCPTQAVRFALEMNQGWFSEKGIKPGMRISGLPQPR